MTAPKRRWFRFSWLLAVATFSVLGIAILALFHWASNGFLSATLVGHTGPVERRDDWPRPLTELLDAEGATSRYESTIQVDCLCRGFDPEYVWRMEATPGLFAKIEKRWRLSKTTDPQLYKLEGYKSRLSGVATPVWWSPRDDGSTSFYVNPQALAREKGDRFHVALDNKRNLIFVYHWFNF
jgi:hypothetical protein